MKLYNVRRLLRKTAAVLGDVEAYSSLDPRKIARHWANKQIGRTMHHWMGGFFLKGGPRKR